MAEWKDQQYPHWNNQKENNILNSINGWSYHRFVCITKDSQVSLWGGIRDESNDGYIEKHLCPIDGTYDIEDILYWTELKVMKGGEE